MARSTSTAKIVNSLVHGLGGDFDQLEAVSVSVFVDRTCPSYLVQALRQALVPARTNASVNVFDIDAANAQTSLMKASDVVLFLSGGSRQVGEKCAEFASQKIPTAIIVESAVEAPQIQVPTEVAAYITILAGTSSEALLERLAAWLCSATDKGVSFAASFPFCRETCIASLIAQCATTNAAIGAVSLLPGSDMALMTASQIRLALDIAASYGLTSRIERIPELAGVIGAGLVYRSAARSMASAIPVFGWFIKVSLGYFGTKATARAIKERIELLRRSEGQPQVEG